MAEVNFDIQSATDQELQAAAKDRRYDHIFYEISGEIARRSEARKQTSSDPEVSTVEVQKPFNPRTDISADAKFLWKRIFIWFWVLPATAVLIYLFVASLKP